MWVWIGQKNKPNNSRKTGKTCFNLTAIFCKCSRLMPCPYKFEIRKRSEPVFGDRPRWIYFHIHISLFYITFYWTWTLLDSIASCWIVWSFVCSFVRSLPCARMMQLLLDIFGIRISICICVMCLYALPVHPL